MKKITFTIVLFWIGFNIVFAQNDGGVYTNKAKTSRTHNGNSALGSIYDFSKCGLNFAYARASVSTRNATTTGSGLPATLAIAGIPAPCTTIEKAYLWSIVAYNYSGGPDPSPASFTVTNPAGATSTYTSVLAGTGVAKCWGEADSRTFRADVTAAVSGNGNYVINTNSPMASVDGMLLMIIFSDGNVSYTGRMMLYDGCYADAAGASENQALNFVTPACAASTFGQAFNLVSDCQYPAVIVHKSKLNGATASYTDNFFNFDIVGTSITSGQSTAAFGVTPGNGGAVSDCYAWGLMGIYFRTTACSPSCPGGCILPLQLINFNASQNATGTLLSWTTASENNTLRFEIERSKDGLNYTSIGTLRASIQSNITQHYNYTDALSLNNAAYYRLKIFDTDGTYKYSDVISLHRSLNDAAKMQLTCINKENKIGITSPLFNENQVQLEITSLTGQIVYKRIVPVSGNEEISVDISSFVTGYYIVKATVGGDLLGVGRFTR